MQYKQFLAQLPPVCWSERPPHTYTVLRGGKQVGVGRVAWQDYGAWNLVHDKFDWSAWVGHEQGVIAWSVAKQALSHSHAGAPLGDTLVALGPQHWPVWWRANRGAVPATARQSIDAMLSWKTVTSVGMP